jgi:serine/threonine protein kinase
VPERADQDLSFLQQRLALCGATVASLSGLFLAAGVVTHLFVGYLGFFFRDQSRPYHVAATLVALAMWLVARDRRRFSIVGLNRIDTAGTIGISALFALMAYSMPPGVGTLVGMLAVSYVTLGRAAQVPSTPQRTLFLTGISLGLIFVQALLRPAPPPLYMNHPGARLFAAIDPLLWSIAGTALATMTSKVIYGLQEKVIEARQLGQYTLEAKIGEGGMGEIYRARHAMLRRRTAIKLLPGDHSEEQLRRFEREVQLTASLTHPNTICIFDYGRTPEGTFYYAMELLEGLNLDTLIENHGAQPAGRVVNLMLQACGALAEAHGVGLIHRDLKPANIFLCRQGGIDDFVKVLDFGLVRQVTAEASITQSSTQLLVGTPLYMAPEAIVTPERIDARTDLYSLGVTAYHLLTGTPPFRGSSLVEVCGHHLHTPPEPPSQRLGQPLPEALEQLILACLAKKPSGRPESAAALGKALAEAAGVAPFSADQARDWWQREFDPDPQHRSIATGRTIQVALDERVAERSELPKAG